MKHIDSFVNVFPDKHTPCPNAAKAALLPAILLSALIPCHAKAHTEIFAILPPVNNAFMTVPAAEKETPAAPSPAPHEDAAPESAAPGEAENAPVPVEPDEAAAATQAKVEYEAIPEDVTPYFVIPADALYDEYEPIPEDVTPCFIIPVDALYNAEEEDSALDITESDFYTPVEESTPPENAAEQGDAGVPEVPARTESSSVSESSRREALPASYPDPAFPSSAPSAEKAAPLPTAQAITPSRSVTMGTRQYLDVVYPGRGWTFLGEEEGKSLLRYFGRRLGAGNTSFTLRARSEGETLLHFVRNDPVTGELIDDWLSVIISDAAGSGGRVTAPDYELIAPEPPADAGSASN